MLENESVDETIPATPQRPVKRPVQNKRTTEAATRIVDHPPPQVVSTPKHRRGNIII